MSDLTLQTYSTEDCNEYGLQEAETGAEWIVISFTNDAEQMRPDLKEKLATTMIAAALAVLKGGEA